MFPYIYLTLPSYMVMAFIGGFVTLLFLYFRSKKYEIAFDDFLKLFLMAAIGCFFGAKVLFFLTMLAGVFGEVSFWDLPILLAVSGYVFYGGLFGSLAAIKLTLQKILGKGYKWESLRNFIAPAFPLFHGFGRIGCFMAGCCYGIPLEVPWQVGGIALERLPTQLIESAYEFFLFAALICLGYRRKRINLLKIYLIAYAIFRFFIEFYRDDLGRGFWVLFSTSQWISIFILLYYIGIFQSVWRKFVHINEKNESRD